MELATALHHIAQRVETPREGVEGEKYHAPRRPKPPLPGKRLAPLVEVAVPQARLEQHSGIGYELVLALDAPVLQMVEQPVDASALAFIKEQEEKAERKREADLGEHVFCRIFRGRKKRKKRLPRSSPPRLVSGCCLRNTRARPRLLRNAWFYSGYMFLPRFRRFLGTNSTLFLREVRSILAATCPHGFLQAKMPGILVGMDQKDIYAATQRPLPLLALYALGKLAFLRATGIWLPLVRCLSRRRSTGKLGVFWETTARYCTVSCV